jgi:hypothetical protein
MSTFLADLPASVSAMAQKALEEEGAQHQPSYANTLALTLDEIVRDVADDETKIRVVRALCAWILTATANDQSTASFLADLAGNMGEVVLQALEAEGVQPRPARRRATEANAKKMAQTLISIVGDVCPNLAKIKVLRAISEGIIAAAEVA